MGKRQFKVLEPGDEDRVFSLDAIVSHVYRCPRCDYVVAVFFPYRAAGHGETSILRYVKDGVQITEEDLTKVDADKSYQCARCSWPYVQADTIREPI